MATRELGFKIVRVVALAARDMARANHFYGTTLGLEPAIEGGEKVGYLIGDTVLMLKDDWYGTPTAEPNPRITLKCADARATEAALREREVTISDAVDRYDENYLVGAFLDSEGNKLWFCSDD
ncbi:MAG: VOC family protein [Rhodocyclaceae bacterium]|nr:VOC family protein [Rhodocyclaceae bacterium]